MRQRGRRVWSFLLCLRRNCVAHCVATGHRVSYAPMLLALTLAFVISGAAGLIYESIWTRYLSLLVGHSAYAQIIVLVIFLGGMSVGALAVGQRSSRIRAPLLWYAGVELAVGLIGFAFHYLLAAGGFEPRLALNIGHSNIGRIPLRHQGSRQGLYLLPQVHEDPEWLGQGR